MMPISAIVTAYQRIEQTLVTLKTLENCEPPPAEILVHVDGQAMECASAIRLAHPNIRVLVSDTKVGPGGGRNRLLAEASHPIVASFDDDSYPIDRDYFARLASMFDRFPDASVVGAHLYHLHEPVAPAVERAAWVADFAGGACAYRRDRFLATSGYVPLRTAYGMEEVDLALQLRAHGGRILQSAWLRVYHDTDRSRHADPEVTAASITNLALLTYLRYPVSWWGIGLAQCVYRIWWCATHGRRRGILAGVARIPAMLHEHRAERAPVPAAAVRSYLRLRRRPVPAVMGAE